MSSSLAVCLSRTIPHFSDNIPKFYLKSSLIIHLCDLIVMFLSRKCHWSWRKPWPAWLSWLWSVILSFPLYLNIPLCGLMLLSSQGAWKWVSSENPEPSHGGGGLVLVIAWTFVFHSVRKQPCPGTWLRDTICSIFCFGPFGLGISSLANDNSAY